MLTQEAFLLARLVNDLRFVTDGVELLDYLLRRGAFKDPASSPRPGLILLDLNMPRMDGREALTQIKADPRLRRIPVVVLTTSKSEEDIFRTYDLGAASFVTKPVSFDALTEIIRVLQVYWLQIVALPPDADVIAGARS